MNPLHIVAATLLLTAIAIVCLTVLAHQRAQLSHLAADRLVDGEAGRLRAEFTKLNDSTAKVLQNHADALKAHENVLTAIENRRAR